MSISAQDKLRVHLVFAPPVTMPRFGELSEGLIPPLGIMYIAAYLRERVDNVEIKITDGLLIGYEKTLREIESFRPDILGLTVYTMPAVGAYAVASRIKEKYPSTFIIAGGPHATALPEEVLERSPIDVVVRGEGEITFNEIVSLYQQGEHGYTESLSKVNGIVFKNNGSFHHSPMRQRISDLDSLPFPARDLIDLSRYKGWYLNKAVSEGAIFMARGCPYHCTFCSCAVWKMSKPFVTFRSPQNIVDEIEELCKRYELYELYDVADEFNNNIPHAIAICEEIKRRKLKISWKANMCAYPLTEELVKVMAETGCWYVLLGVESGNQETINGVRKRITLEQVERACRLFHKYGIKVMGLFMLFNVWEENGVMCYENTEAVKNTFKYIRRMVREGLMDFIGWSVAVPYPGSRLYDIAMRHNLIREKYVGNWEKWLAGDTYIMKLPGISRKQQIRMKTLGSILRAKLILRNHNFKIQNFALFAKKTIKLALDEVNNLIRDSSKH